MKKIYALFILVLSLFSCTDDYLDKKPNQSLIIPSTLPDLEALLNNTSLMNTTPSMGILGADDYFITAQGWQELTNPIEKYGYTWEEDIYRGQLACTDWSSPYQQVFYSNVVLDGLNEIPVTVTNQQQWSILKGRALFQRAHAEYNIAQLFASPYSVATTAAPGIPLRLSSEIDIPVKRSSLEESYAQIIADLLEAAELLPPVMTTATQPSKAAVHALLARTYLMMNNYEQAEEHATQSLTLKNTLINYNTLNTTSTRPIARLNEEVLYHATTVSYRFITSTLTYVDTLLFAKYNTNDLRRSIYYRNRGVNRYNFKGNYTGASSLFGGLSVNEVYLTRAECRARLNKLSGALEDINALLLTRWKTGTFNPITGNDQNELLALILSERQKELVFRPTRWSDLRRLNQEETRKKTLSRKREEQVFTLLPNDKRYVYAIPPQEIMYSNIEQNPR